MWLACVPGVVVAAVVLWFAVNSITESLESQSFLALWALASGASLLVARRLTSAGRAVALAAATALLVPLTAWALWWLVMSQPH